MNFAHRLLRRLPARTVYAHCDIPCGIYEINTMTTAAFTCVRMVKGLLALEPADHGDQAAMLKYHNDVARMVAVKERHAQLVKEQVLVLWTDYFKEPQLETFPELHTTIWTTAKQCSKVKQTVSLEEAEKLEQMVHLIADTFAKAEAAKKSA